MRLSSEDIEKFKSLYKMLFGKEVSNEDAYEKGIKLLRLMKVIYRPMTEKQYRAIQENCETMLRTKYAGKDALHDFLNEV